MRDKESNRYIERICSEVLNFMKDEPVKIYLFGSWARGDQSKGSDVDIAIESPIKKITGKIGELRDLLEESTIPYRVDVVDMSFAAQELIQEIRKDGILWKE